MPQVRSTAVSSRKEAAKSSFLNAQPHWGVHIFQATQRQPVSKAKSKIYQSPLHTFDLHNNPVFIFTLQIKSWALKVFPPEAPGSPSTQQSSLLPICEHLMSISCNNIHMKKCILNPLQHCLLLKLMKACWSHYSSNDKLALQG